MAYTVSKALRQNPTPMWEAQLAPDTQTLKEKIRQQLYSYDPSINRGTVVVVEEPRPDPKPPILEGRDLDLD